MKDKCHPLLPIEGSDNIPDIQKLTIIRHETNGGQVTYPHTIDAEVLQSIEQLTAMVGGGTYEIQGKNSEGRIVKKHKYVFEGAPIPFGERGAREPSQQQQAQVIPVTQAHAPDQNILSMVLAQAQSTAAQAREDAKTNSQMMMQFMGTMMTAMAQANSQSTSIIVAALQSGKSETSEIMKTLLLAKEKQTGGGMQGAMDVLKQAVAFGMQMAGGDGEEAPSLEESLAPLLQGWMQGMAANGGMGGMPGMGMPGGPPKPNGTPPQKQGGAKQPAQPSTATGG